MSRFVCIYIYIISIGQRAFWRKVILMQGELFKATYIRAKFTRHAKGRLDQL